jgi:hypothetical protein
MTCSTQSNNLKPITISLIPTLSQQAGKVFLSLIQHVGNAQHEELGGIPWEVEEVQIPQVKEAARR